MIDPGLDGDAYADQPYLYGPALSSWNHFRIGGKENQEGADGLLDNGDPTMTSDFYDEVVEEGGEGSGEAIREELNIPDTPDERKKWFLDEHNRESFVFEEGRLYKADFGNPYLVFNGEFLLQEQDTKDIYQLLPSSCMALSNFHVQTSPFISPALRSMCSSMSTRRTTSYDMC